MVIALPLALGSAQKRLNEVKDLSVAQFANGIPRAGMSSAMGGEIEGAEDEEVNYNRKK